jgi:hypothetical protein
MPGQGRTFQLKELLVFTVLSVLQVLVNLQFSAASSQLLERDQNPLLRISLFYAQYIHPVVATVVIVGLLLGFVQLARSKRLPRLALDLVGGWMVFRLLFTFVSVNALLFTTSASPQLMLGEIATFFPYFVICWGWIFWRLDWFARQGGRPRLVIVDASDPITSFDYYHATLASVVAKGASTVKGLSRLGRSLVAIYSLMVLDLLGVALTRAFQLSQQVF